MILQRLLFISLCLFISACDFTVPLSASPGMAIDERALGLWERTKSGGKKERLLLLPLNGNEYFVSWPKGAQTELYARSHLFEFNDRVLVQVEWFGNSSGAVPDDDRNYQLASYTISGNRLEIRMVNAGLTGKDFNSTAGLAEAIEKNSDNPDLFLEPMVYTRVPD